MAQEVQIPGAGSTAKIRNIIAVPVLAVVTLGVYLVCWCYFVNRELADLGRARGTEELGDSPAKSTLALFPGALVIVPALWTTVTTFQRVQRAQRLANRPTTMAHMFWARSLVSSADMAFSYPVNGIWQQSTWGETRELVERRFGEILEACARLDGGQAGASTR